ncbi:hypothetical protein KSF_082330 [Reticulibacter mediterranei]|uniref:ClbS/DfsB family four-helix bundle protein n=1 Tax=Reticulibacter mediterranei TaxID=2778369 RepID=A0A8J3N777_9CHLR|nr:DinB family protein [Reticulibacter mediterranei]GHO98185.1 hypothetical protein KSF_082330 [Reticulibacter mediterranei]
MAITASKAELLDKVQQGYVQFEDLLAPLSKEQMTTPNVNSTWSIKDNIAHLTVWQNYLLSRLRGVIDGSMSEPEFLSLPGTEDEQNEQVYQQNKDRPLADVLADFRSSYQSVLATIQSMSEESLNGTFPWSTSDRQVWPLIVGNTYEHYAEHSAIIQHWLESVRGQA